MDARLWERLESLLREHNGEVTDAMLMVNFSAPEIDQIMKARIITFDGLVWIPIEGALAK